MWALKTDCHGNSGVLCAKHLAFTISFTPNNSNFTNRGTEHRKVKTFSEDYASSMWQSGFEPWLSDPTPCALSYSLNSPAIQKESGKLSHFLLRLHEAGNNRGSSHESGSTVHHDHSTSPMPPPTFLHRAERVE